MSPIARSIATAAAVLLIAISVLLLPQVVAAEYPMFHNDPQRTGNVSGYAPATGTLMWNTSLTGFVGGGACISNGRVYVSNWPGMDGNPNLGLFCLDESDGSVIWTNPLAGNGGVSTPAIECGRVFAGATYFSGDLYCIDASDGTTIWNLNVEPSSGYHGVASSPLIHNSMVYVVSSSDGRLHAFDFDGTEQWNYSASGSSDNYMSAATDGSKLFFGGGNAMNCVNIATQTEEWTFVVGDKVTTTPAVCDGVVYFATGKSEKKLYAVDIATGTIVWSRYLYGSLSSPAISGGRIYIGDKDKKINSINASDGSEVWNQTLGGVCQSSPVVANGMVYVTANYGQGTVYGFDADTGDLIWTYDTGNWNMAQPAVSDGTLFIGSDSGYLYAFRDPPIPKGDLNRDWTVTAADAAIALRMAVGAVPAIEEADMSCDGRVTSLDALMILQVAAGGTKL